MEVVSIAATSWITSSLHHVYFFNCFKIKQWKKLCLLLISPKNVNSLSLTHPMVYRALGVSWRMPGQSGISTALGLVLDEAALGSCSQSAPWCCPSRTFSGCLFSACLLLSPEGRFLTGKYVLRCGHTSRVCGVWHLLTVVFALQHGW